MDNNLKYCEHLDYICKKISKKIGVLNRIRNNVSTLCRKIVYNTTILSHFQYMLTILYLYSRTKIKRLQILQKKATHVIDIVRLTACWTHYIG